MIVRGLHISAKIRAVDRDIARKRAFVASKLYGLTDLVQHDEGGLVVDRQIAGKLEGAIALGAVYEHGDCGEDVADGQLAAMENRARGDAELLAATLALVDLAGGEIVGIAAPAHRANRLAVRVGPADLAESGTCFRVRHAHDLDQREGLGGGREEEMLRHIKSGDVVHRI